MISEISKIKANFLAISLICVISFVVFFINIGVIGPMIQADEGSYLANAAAIAGYTNDFASSYSAGYSILISPAFVIASEPQNIWLVVKLINAILYLILGIGIWMLSGTSFYNSKSNKDRIFCTIIVLIYPMWTIMVGYSFSQLAFASFFVWSMFFLQKFLESNSKLSFLVFCILLGYLYWIHPTGLAVVIAGGIALLVFSLKKRNLLYIFSYLFIVGLVLGFYRLGFEPWLVGKMTIGGDPSLHYPGLNSLFTPLSSVEGLGEVLGRTAGHILYLILGTVGLFFIGLKASLAKSKNIVIYMKSLSEKERLFGITHLMLVLSIMGVLALSVLLFSSAEATRLDHWMYGRYVEGVLAPLLLIGAASFTRKGVFQSIIVAAAVAGLLFIFIGEYSHTARFNISTFWQDFYLREQGLLAWFGYGALIMLVAASIGNRFGRVVIVLLFSFCTYLQVTWHERAAYAASSRWGAALYLRENFESGTCVGFDHSGINNYSKHVFWFDFGFQLFDYKLKRLNPEQWAAGDCSGPLFSFSDNINNELGIPAFISAISPNGGPNLWEKGQPRARDLYPIDIGSRPASLAQALLQGWHGREAKHVWSSKKAILSLPVPDSCVELSCFVSLKFGLFGASMARPVEVVFENKSSDHDSTRFKYTSSGPFVFQIKLDSTQFRNKISIEVPDGVSPKELVGSNDSRVLGIALYSVTFQRIN
jgi:hypothetical protein